MRRRSLGPLCPRPGGISGLFCCSSSDPLGQQPGYPSTPPGTPDARGKATQRMQRQTCSRQWLEEPGDVWSIQPALHEPSSSLPKPGGAGAYRLVPHGPQSCPSPSPSHPNKMYSLQGEPQILLALLQPLSGFKGSQRADKEMLTSST